MRHDGQQCFPLHLPPGLPNKNLQHKYAYYTFCKKKKSITYPRGLGLVMFRGTSNKNKYFYAQTKMH